MASELRQLLAERGVAEQPIVLRRPNRLLHRQRVDGDHAAKRAGDVDLHARIEKDVVRNGELRTEDAGGDADVEHAVIGGDAQRARAAHVELNGVGILGVHAEFLQKVTAGQLRCRWAASECSIRHDSFPLSVR